MSALWLGKCPEVKERNWVELTSLKDLCTPDTLGWSHLWFTDSADLFLPHLPAARMSPDIALLSPVWLKKGSL